MELFIIRHGESVTNTSPTLLADGGLTERGRAQAKKVAVSMVGARLTHIFSSPLMRAIETAQPLARAVKLPVEVWLDAHEVWTGGGYRGPTTEQLAEMYPEIRFAEETESDPLGWHCPGGETSETGYLRANRLLERLRSRFTGDERVALFAHGALNRRLMLAALGMEYSNALRPFGDNGCVWWLGFEDGKMSIRYIGPAIPQLFQVVD
ncbi:histidine phosphatase family protein [Paenibacillus contaminans]|jgi:broad specificity phosphatase PhoE|uniref:Histidine phosphatase family protein n=1 Tax=Paenibacillus contaminans TaxID=450362 RepID=A0A329MN18_9BACL|nr:histidine phosphatase family protein [Paenibacillus contaminans]RAV20686.1 histidine phosphatase family protein [Paenibacillus contaminans]